MTPTRIILHHSLTADSKTLSWGAIRRYHIDHNNWQDIGYHFGIELVGTEYEILVGRMQNHMGAHAKGCNADSLGICFVGNFDEINVPQRQWDIGVRLVRSLCEIYHIKRENIIGHNQVSGKTCPGTLFDVPAFVNDVFDSHRRIA